MLYIFLLSQYFFQLNCIVSLLPNIKCYINKIAAKTCVHGLTKNFVIMLNQRLKVNFDAYVSFC